MRDTAICSPIRLRAVRSDCRHFIAAGASGKLSADALPWLYSPRSGSGNRRSGIAPATRRVWCASMAERSFKQEVEKLKLGAGAEFRGEGILAITKALLESGVSYVAGYQGAPIS